MATANFIYNENFPIVAISDEQYEEFFSDCEDMEDFVADLFKPLNLVFFRPKLSPGYYEGVQILFEVVGDPNEMSNDETQYWFGMCRSKAIRVYKSEINKINRKIDKLVECSFWMKLSIRGRFSNGECVYQQV